MTAELSSVRVRATGWQDLGLKVIAVGLAFFTWYAARHEGRNERVLELHPQFTGLAENLVVVRPASPRVSVTLAGPAGRLAKVPAADLRLRVPLDDVHRPGRRLVEMGSLIQHVPRGMEVIRVTPSTMEVEVDRLVTRRVTLKPDVTGTPSADHELGTVSVDPPSLEISGPESALADVHTVGLSPVSVAGRSQPVDTRVTVILPEALQEVLALVTVHGPTTVRLRAAINGRSASVVWTIPVHTRGAGEWIFAPAAVQVELQGPPETMERLRRNQVAAWAELPATEGAPSAVNVELAPEVDQVVVKSVVPAAVTARRGG